MKLENLLKKKKHSRAINQLLWELIAAYNLGMDVPLALMFSFEGPSCEVFKKA